MALLHDDETHETESRAMDYEDRIEMREVRPHPVPEVEEQEEEEEEEELVSRNRSTNVSAQVSSQSSP
jgi:hypothetical protein